MKPRLVLYLLLGVIAFLGLAEESSYTQEYEIASSETVSLIYENSLASIYRLPRKGTLEKASERFASLILQQLAQKGLTDILTEVTSVLVSKLGGLFLTFITEMPEVGIPTKVDIVVLARNDTINTIQTDRDFLPLIIVAAGDCFNYGVLLTCEYSPQLFEWETVKQVQLLDFEELSALYQKGLLQYGDRFVVVPKESFRLPIPGKYRLFVRSWCDSEGKSSYRLRAVEVSREQMIFDGSLQSSFEALAKHMRKREYQHASHYTFGELAKLLQLLDKGEMGPYRIIFPKEVLEEEARGTLDRLFLELFYSLTSLSAEDSKIIETKSLSDRDALVLVQFVADKDSAASARDVYLCHKEKNRWQFDSYFLSQAKKHINSVLLKLEQSTQFSLPLPGHYLFDRLSSPERSLWLISDVILLSSTGLITLQEAEDLFSICLSGPALEELKDANKDLHGGGAQVTRKWVHDNAFPDWRVLKIIQRKATKGNSAVLEFYSGEGKLYGIYKREEGDWQLHEMLQEHEYEEIPARLKEKLRLYPENLDEVIETLPLRAAEVPREKQEQERKQEPRDEKFFAKAPGDFLMYENSEYGIRIGYPREWTKKEDFLGSIVYLLSPQEDASDTFRENLNIGVQELPTTASTLDELTKLGINQNRQLVTHFDLIKSEAASLAGMPAHRIVFMGKEGQYNLKWMQTWTLHNNKLWVVTFTAEVDKYSKFIGTIKKMIESFQILCDRKP